MAEYIKREMPDMNGNGERKAYYQVRSYVTNLSLVHNHRGIIAHAATSMR